MADTEMKDVTQYSGKITHLASEGYGFISCKEIPFTRIFFHWTSLPPNVKFPNLEKGQEVSFQIREDPERGTQAIKIKLV